MLTFDCKSSYVHLWTLKHVEVQVLGHGPHSPPPGAAASTKRLKKVAKLQFATEPVWAQNPESQPTKVYPSHN